MQTEWQSLVSTSADLNRATNELADMIDRVELALQRHRKVRPKN